LFVVRSRNPRLVAAKAEQHLTAGRKEAAHRVFLRAIALLDAGAGKGSERSQLMGQTCLRLGELEESSGRRAEAFGYYTKARQAGAQLPAAAILLLAECYAETGSTSEDALQAYLTYIASGPTSGHARDNVYTVLQGLCQVFEETTKSVERKAAAEVNRRVIAVNPNLEWAHYYLGLANLLDGHAIEAKNSFSIAQTLNPNRSLTYYWLGVCLLQQPEPDLNEAIVMIERFLQHPSQDPKHSRREAKVCSEIGKRLIEKLGGFEADGDCSGGERKETLGKAIHYFEAAVLRRTDDASSQFLLARSYVLAKDTPHVLAALERAVELAPNETTYAYRLGVERERVGDRAGAIQTLHQAVIADPNHGDSHALLGALLVRSGDYIAAEASVRHALRLLGKKPSYYALLLRSLFGQNKYAAVIQEVEQIPPRTISAEDHRDAVLAVARSYSLEGRFDHAREWLQGLRGEPEGLYYLGCAHAHCSQLDDEYVLRRWRMGKVLMQPERCWREGMFLGLRDTLIKRRTIIAKYSQGMRRTSAHSMPWRCWLLREETWKTQVAFFQRCWRSNPRTPPPALR